MRADRVRASDGLVAFPNCKAMIGLTRSWAFCLQVASIVLNFGVLVSAVYEGIYARRGGDPTRSRNMPDRGSTINNPGYREPRHSNGKDVSPCHSPYGTLDPAGGELSNYHRCSRGPSWPNLILTVFISSANIVQGYRYCGI